MIHADDFREAFGKADSGFEKAVNDTLRQLAAKEEKQPLFRRPRVLVPAIAAVMIMALGIGLASTGHWGILDWLHSNRPDAPEATALPAANETAGPYADPVDAEYVTVTVREARSDGYGLYLSVLFTPKEEGVLAYNWGVDPFTDGPETMGIDPDCNGQTLSEWAAGHGYHSLIRVSLFSLGFSFPEGMTLEEMEAYLTEQGIPFRKTSTGFIMDRVSNGEDVDSYLNNTMVLEEDGSTLIMASGGSIAGQEQLTLGWAAVPCLMSESGMPQGGGDSLDTKAWTQGWIPLSVPDAGPGEAQVLAEYTGAALSKSGGNESLPVTVQLIRTELNDYYVISTTDTERSFLSPVLSYEAEGGKQAGDRFARSDIYIASAQEKNSELLFTVACRIPEELPERLIITWFDTDSNPNPEMTPVEKKMPE